MDKEKISFLIYLDYEEHFELMTDEQLGQLIRAIMEYEKTRQVPQLDGMVKMAFSFIKAQLDRDREKYEGKCAKNKENGKKGGRPKINQMVLKKTQQKPKNPIKKKIKIKKQIQIYLKRKKKKEKPLMMFLQKIILMKI